MAPAASNNVNVDASEERGSSEGFEMTVVLGA